VLKADALALDHVDAHCRAVEQQIDHVIVEQVDFIDIEHAAVGRGQNARLKVALARSEWPFRCRACRPRDLRWR
jgi:hypothetical protein